MKKKSILITAASSKLGRYLVTYFSTRGYRVYATLRDTNDKEKVSKVQYFELDLTNVEQIDRAFQQINKLGDLDVVINLGGITSSGKLFDSTEDDYLNILKINTISQFSILQHAYIKMSGQNSGGRVININSLNGIVPIPNFGIYSASKFAADTIGLIAHMEYADSKVKITNIAPGAIDFGTAPQESLKHKTLRERVPIFKLLLPFTSPENVAKRIFELIESRDNPARIVVGSDAKIVYLIYRILPMSLWLTLIRVLWKK